MLIPACASADLVMKKGAMVVIKYVDGMFVDADGVSVCHGADGALIRELEAPLSAGATQVGSSSGPSTLPPSAYPSHPFIRLRMPHRVRTWGPPPVGCRCISEGTGHVRLSSHV